MRRRTRLTPIVAGGYTCRHGCGRFCDRRDSRCATAHDKQLALEPSGRERRRYSSIVDVVVRGDRSSVWSGGNELGVTTL